MFLRVACSTNCVKVVPSVTVSPAFIAPAVTSDVISYSKLLALEDEKECNCLVELPLYENSIVSPSFHL